MKNEFTPGPWLADANNCHAGQVAVCHGDDDGYAEVWSENWTMEDGHRSQFANARLIAAAPDLLEALIHIQQVACSGSPELLIASEAIAKATGAAA